MKLSLWHIPCYYSLSFNYTVQNLCTFFPYPFLLIIIFKTSQLNTSILSKIRVMSSHNDSMRVTSRVESSVAWFFSTFNWSTIVTVALWGHPRRYHLLLHLRLLTWLRLISLFDDFRRRPLFSFYAVPINNLLQLYDIAIRFITSINRQLLKKVVKVPV